MSKLDLHEWAGTAERKQWIVIRKDLNMPAGKLAAQAAHASMGALLNHASVQRTDGKHDYVNIEINDDVGAWLGGRFTKICLAVNSEIELDNMAHLCEQAGLNVCRITDAGLTVFNEPTFTCFAVGPHLPEHVKPILGILKLYQ